MNEIIIICVAVILLMTVTYVFLKKRQQKLFRELEGSLSNIAASVITDQSIHFYRGEYKKLPKLNTLFYIKVPVGSQFHDLKLKVKQISLFKNTIYFEPIEKEYTCFVSRAEKHFITLKYGEEKRIELPSSVFDFSPKQGDKVKVIFSSKIRVEKA